MFNTIVFICKLILGLLPFAWGIALLMYEKKDKCEKLVSWLTVSLFYIGLTSCIYIMMDVIFYLLGW